MRCNLPPLEEFQSQVAWPLASSLHLWSTLPAPSMAYVRGRTQRPGEFQHRQVPPESLPPPGQPATTPLYTDVSTNYTNTSHKPKLEPAILQTLHILYQLI